MGMPAALDRYYTRDEVLAFPDDGKRYELVYGELLVSPSPVPRHQRIALCLAAELLTYLRRHPVGEVLMSPADISWGRPDVTAQPDVFVVAKEDAGVCSWEQMRRFLLFVEVLSPSTSRHDRFTKRRLYQDEGVPLYWIIDAERERAPRSGRQKPSFHLLRSTDSSGISRERLSRSVWCSRRCSRSEMVRATRSARSDALRRGSPFSVAFRAGCSHQGRADAAFAEPLATNEVLMPWRSPSLRTRPRPVPARSVLPSPACPADSHTSEECA